MKYLKIYCASDDLVEFDGAFVEEYNIYERTEFDVTATSNDGRERAFTITAEFDDGWELALSFCSHDETDEGFIEAQYCWFNGVTFEHIGKNADPCIIVPLFDEETVVVNRVGDDEDD